MVFGERLLVTSMIEEACTKCLTGVRSYVAGTSEVQDSSTSKMAGFKHIQRAVAAGFCQSIFFRTGQTLVTMDLVFQQFLRQKCAFKPSLQSDRTSVATPL